MVVQCNQSSCVWGVSCIKQEFLCVVRQGKPEFLVGVVSVKTRVLGCGVPV